MREDGFRGKERGSGHVSQIPKFLDPEVSQSYQFGLEVFNNSVPLVGFVVRKRFC